MVNLNKSLSLAVAALGVSVGIANPELAMGQINSALTGINAIADSFTPDPLPFATPYRPISEVPQDFVGEVPARVAADDGETDADPIPAPTVVANPVPVVDVQPVSVAPTARPVQSAPTVILRPSVDDSNQFNDLTVEVNKLEDRPGNEFAIKVTVPDSVKIVELVPVQGENLRQNFKIRMEQNSEPTAVDSIAENTMPINASPRVPVRMASNPDVAISQPTIEEENSVQTGYKRNPFFGNRSLVPASEPIIAKAETQLPHAVADSGWPKKNQLPKVPSKLSAYRKPSAESVMQPNPKPPLGSLHGPRSMGLGDIGDFKVYVTNQNPSPQSNLSVQLEVPPGLDIVVLDRAATVDQSNGTLTWQLPDAKPGEEQLIRYRVRSLAEGFQQQRLTVSSQHGQFSTEIGTDVQLKDSPEAPLLPFESN